jgi:hypothetical protein
VSFDARDLFTETAQRVVDDEFEVIGHLLASIDVGIGIQQHLHELPSGGRNTGMEVGSRRRIRVATPGRALIMWR